MLSNFTGIKNHTPGVLLKAGRNIKAVKAKLIKRCSKNIILILSFTDR